MKVCFQKQLRDKLINDDLKEWNLTEADISKMRVSDFKFKYISKDQTKRCNEIKEFIQKYEWLGKLPKRPTHRFVYLYEGKVIAVLILATPNAFSYCLGKEYMNYEKLISRGAVISWAPKNTASSLISKSLKWMVKNTEFRIFSAYSDTEASELGTIYQACNFIYLGKNFGSRYQFFDPNNPERGWFSDRIFRKVGQYKKYAQSLNIDWDSSWSTRWSMNWDYVPDEIVSQLKAEAKRYQSSCTMRKVPKKHKYLYILGRNKTETKSLINRFKEHNPKLVKNDDFLGLKYPKIRGE